MSRFNIPQQRKSPTAPICTVASEGSRFEKGSRDVPTTRTHENGAGWLRNSKSELFTLAVVNMHGTDSFYESGESKDNRYASLIRELAVADPLWTSNLLKWLRGPEGNLRTASLVGAAEFVHARLEAGVPDFAVENGRGVNRIVIGSVLQRGDEPGELLAYWASRYGAQNGDRVRNGYEPAPRLPMALKRGVADALIRLYTERAFLRYDSSSAGFRFGDVIDLVHPAPKLPNGFFDDGSDKTPEEISDRKALVETRMSDLFRYAMDSRHGRDCAIPETLRLVAARNAVNKLSPEKRHHLAKLALRDGLDAGVYGRAMAGQWEWLHSILGDTTGVSEPISKLDQWRLVLPQLGIFALARNLRNLEQAGVGSDSRIVNEINRRLSDPDEIAKSRMMPFRWWQAYKESNSHLFSQGLDNAVNLSLRNIPELPGKSLVLIDTSGSMTNGLFDKKSSMTPVQAGALFGISLTARNPGNVSLYGFAGQSMWGNRTASSVFSHEVYAGASVLRSVDEFVRRVGEVGHGTDIHGSVRATYKHGYHDRIFIISDMQTIGGHGHDHFNGVVPRTVPVYAFNLGGYSASAMSTGSDGRYELGGLTDATFKMVKYLERGKDAAWPWEMTED